MDEKIAIPDLVIIDLDNTLYEYEPCHSVALDRMLAYLSEELNRHVADLRADFQQARKRVKDRLGSVASSHSRLLYLEQLMLDIDMGFRPEIILTAERLYWSTFLGIMRLRDEAESFLLDLRRIDCKVVVLTDLTSDIQNKKILKLGIYALVDHVFSSEFIGSEKSQLTSFAFVLSNFAGDIQSLWAIGDEPHDLISKSSTLDNGSRSITNFNINHRTFNDLRTSLSNSATRMGSGLT